MRSVVTSLLLTAALLLVAPPPSATAQPAEASLCHGDLPSEAPVQVMLLGTVHLDDPGRDVSNPRVPDVTTPEHQEELEAIREALARFRPAKIALEVQKKHQAALDSLYGAFRAGRMDTSFSVGDLASKRSEHYQLGFRLADRLEHERVWAVDYFEKGMNLGRVLSYAREHDTSFVNYFQRFSKGERPVDSLLQEGTLQEMYRYLNRPERVERYLVPYARTATVAEDTAYVGTEVVAQYYKRNLHIFANIEEAAEAGDRVLVIFGAGHMPFLRPLVKASPQMQFVDPLRCL